MADQQLPRDLTLPSLAGLCTCACIIVPNSLGSLSLPCSASAPALLVTHTPTLAPLVLTHAQVLAWPCRAFPFVHPWVGGSHAVSALWKSLSRGADLRQAFHLSFPQDVGFFWGAPVTSALYSSAVWLAQHLGWLGPWHQSGFGHPGSSACMVYSRKIQKELLWRSK